MSADSLPLSSKACHRKPRGHYTTVRVMDRHPRAAQRLHQFGKPRTQSPQRKCFAINQLKERCWYSLLTAERSVAMPATLSEFEPQLASRYEDIGDAVVFAIHARRSGLRTNKAKSPVRTSMPITNPKTGIQLPVASKIIAAMGAPSIEPTPCAM